MRGAKRAHEHPVSVALANEWVHEQTHTAGENAYTVFACIKR